MKKIALSLCLMLSVAYGSIDDLKETIEVNIKPIGQVSVEGAEKVPEKTVEAAAPAVRDGKTIYQQHCVVCHQTGLAGAPKLHDDNDWGPRLKAKKIEGLLASSLKGLNAMPAKGTCSECTDDDLKKAIEYMLPGGK